MGDRNNFSNFDFFFEKNSWKQLAELYKMYYLEINRKKIKITKFISISQISPQNELVKMCCTVEKIRKKIAHVFK